MGTPERTVILVLMLVLFILSVYIYQNSRSGTFLSRSQDTKPEDLSKCEGLLGPPSFATSIDTTVRGKSVAMFVYTRDDLVSESLKKYKYWDLDKTWQLLDAMRESGRPFFLDVGSNVGWFTLTLANHGYQVVAFDPMTDNEKLLIASLCASSSLLSKVEFHRIGLGDTAQTCFIKSGRINAGDGISVCVPEGQAYDPGADYVIRENITIRRFDSFSYDPVQFGAVKIDIEGFEGRFLRGAIPFFNRSDSPRFVVSEFAPGMMRGSGIDPIEHLRLWDSLGYDGFSDGFFEPQGAVKTRQSETYIAPVRFVDWVEVRSVAVPIDDIFWLKRTP